MTNLPVVANNLLNKAILEGLYLAKAERVIENQYPECDRRVDIESELVSLGNGEYTLDNVRIYAFVKLPPSAEKIEVSITSISLR